jgi:septal ring factor EnvC (AmiA/AmiB activator)
MARYGWLISLVGLVVVLTLLIISIGDYDDLQASYDTAQEQNSSLSAQLLGSQSQANQLQSDLTATQAELEAAKAQIIDLQNTPTARYFSSISELQNWLVQNTVSEQVYATTYAGWYAKALQVQRDALNDGYIISVQYHYCDEEQQITYIACIASVGGYLWMWDPETDDIYPDNTMGRIS